MRRMISTKEIDLIEELSKYISLNANNIIMVLPTSDPGVEGALWNDNGVLKISAGE